MSTALMLIGTWLLAIRSFPLALRGWASVESKPKKR